ncbi:MAG: ABC transporter ATP-binding protein [Anaerolineaceae bacterium]|nr:ABC transporter ATP-binding protein [Anaerolineaceae bacterium]
MAPILQLKGITKQFPGVLANDNIDLTLNQGEILALLGENGAGKSTLMNILYGLYQPDKGEIEVNGKKVTIHSPTDAINAGIGMVHQHFMLIPVFTVTENIMLGSEPVKAGGFLDRPKTAAKILDISRQYNLEVNPNDYVKDLPVGVQQRVEIIKLLYREANILIFDEPTAVLTPQEADELFEIMHALVKQGKSIIFITHKLREVLDVADRIMVIRRGAVVGEADPKKANRNQLAEMMVGREVNLEVDKKFKAPGEVVLSVKDLVVADQFKQIIVDKVTFDVHAGQILGIAGVQGNGQTELVNAITGLGKSVSGEIVFKGQNILNASPRRITELGSAHVPEDRQADGLVLPFPVAENLVLCTYYKKPFAKGIVLQYQNIFQNSEKLVEDFDIRTPSSLTAVGNLSGGNQQKVIIARELSRPIELLVASQPTRGLDVGSIEYIHKRIVQKRDEGCAVLLVSPELDEVIELSDRIAVMFRGKIIAIVEAEGVSKETLGLLMAGIVPDKNEDLRSKRVVETTF